MIVSQGAQAQRADNLTGPCNAYHRESERERETEREKQRESL